MVDGGSFFWDYEIIPRVVGNDGGGAGSPPPKREPLRGQRDPKMVKKLWKHYKLVVKGGGFTRWYYTVAHTETEARASCQRWADGLAFEGPVRLLRKQTITES